MNSNRTSFADEILCPSCLEIYEGILSEKVEDIQEEKANKSIYDIEHDLQKKEEQIQQSLSEEARGRCWLLVEGVYNLANWRVGKAVAEHRGNGGHCDFGEQSILFNILISSAWIATQTYDASQSKFISYIQRPWNWAIKEFWRIQPISIHSLSATDSNNDTEGCLPLENRIADTHISSPDSRLVLEEWENRINTAFKNFPLIEIIIQDARDNLSDLCPFCRKKLRESFLKYKIPASKGIMPLFADTAYTVFAHRKLWIKILSENSGGYIRTA